MIDRNTIATVLLGTLLTMPLSGCSREAAKTKHLTRADQYFGDQKFAEAEIEYQNVLKLEDSNPHAMRQLGQIAFDEGRFSLAHTHFHRAVALEPDHVPSRLVLGDIHLVLRDPAGARGHALKALETEPENETGWILLSDSSRTTAELEEAVQLLEKVRPTSETKAAFHVALGTLRLKQQDFEASDVAYQQALSLDPQSSAALFGLGNLRLIRGEPEAAEEAYQKAADLLPPNSPRRLHYSDFLVRTGKIAEAREVLNEFPDYLPARMRLAELAFADRRLDECGELLRGVLRRDPGNYSALMLAGRLSMARNDAAKAVQEFGSMAQYFPNAPEVHFHLGIANLMARDIPATLRALGQAVDRDPNYAEAILLLSEIHLKSGNPAYATQMLPKVRRERPGIPKVGLVLAEAYLAQNRAADAIEIYRDLSRQNPEDVEMLMLLGNALARNNRIDQAREVYERIQTLSAGHMASLETLVNLDLVQRRFDRAEERLAAQIQAHPQAIEPQILLGRVYTEKGDLNRAVAHMSKVVAENSSNASAVHLLSRVHTLSQDYDKALEVLRRVDALTPERAEVQMEIGMVHEAKGDFQAARIAYERAIALNPSYGPALNNLAVLHLEKFNDLERAHDLIRKAREVLPADPYIADTYGWTLYRRGEYARALPLVEESARQLRENPDVRYHLGMIHYMLGEEAPARTHLQASVEQQQDARRKADGERRLRILDLDSARLDAQGREELEQQVQFQPDDPIAQLRWAEVREREGAFAQAAESYERLLQTRPNDIRAILRLADLYAYQLDQRDRALALGRRARTLAPNDPAVAEALGRIALQGGDTEWAMNLLQEAARRNPGSPEIQRDLALAFYAQGRLPDSARAMEAFAKSARNEEQKRDAEQWLRLHRFATQPATNAPPEREIEAILNARPNDLPALHARAVMHEQAGRREEAIRAYEPLLRAYPRFAPRNPLVGIAAFRIQDYRRAVEVLSEVERQRTGDSEILYYLGMAHYQLGRNDQSRDALSKALASEESPVWAEEARRVLAELN
jgi:cellulose synthase operon protein C